MKRTTVISILILFSVGILLVSSCEKDNISGDIVVDNQLREDLYSKSNDTLLIENQKLVLETELYRNFFPGGPPPSIRPLIASLDIKSIDSLQLPYSIDITNLFVINDVQIWISTPTSCDNCYIPDYILRRTCNNGPEWETNIYVDVIVEITDFNTSYKYYLIAKDQLIYKVE